jgi:hypothetical protein
MTWKLLRDFVQLFVDLEHDVEIGHSYVFYQIADPRNVVDQPQNLCAVYESIYDGWRACRLHPRLFLAEVNVIDCRWHWNVVVFRVGQPATKETASEPDAFLLESIPPQDERDVSDLSMNIQDAHTRLDISRDSYLSEFLAETSIRSDWAILIAMPTAL